ncbi:PPOX class F420-dependent oxidoreductase [soil metagenome]
MIPDSHVDLVTGTSFAHVATIGPDGEPQSTPVWIDGDATTVKFSQTTGRQKYENVQREPRVAMSMIDMVNPYRYLEIRGRVVDVADDTDNAFIDSMASKYMGKDSYPFHQPGDHRVVVTVEPEHTTQMG